MRKDSAPADPVERIRWVRQFQSDLTGQLAEAMFEARMQGRFEEARLAAGLSRKVAFAMTRAVNEQRGRQVRWNGL